jgi:hypothetical protein
MSKYSKNLVIPFELDLFPSVKASGEGAPLDKLGHFKYDKSSLPQELIEFMRERDLQPGHCEVFYTPPGASLPIHVDGEKLSNLAKINWCYGGPGSMMTWYKLLVPESEVEQKQTGLETSYLIPSFKQCRMIHSAKIGLPTLVNVGVPHAVINPSRVGRWVLSVVPYDLQLGSNLSFDVALERLSR